MSFFVALQESCFHLFARSSAFASCWVVPPTLQGVNCQWQLLNKRFEFRVFLFTHVTVAMATTASREELAKYEVGGVQSVDSSVLSRREKEGEILSQAMEGGVVALTNPGKDLVPVRASLLPFEQLPNLPKPIVPEIDLGIKREDVLAIE